jgi:hypothetical protein
MPAAFHGSRRPEKPAAVRDTWELDVGIAHAQLVPGPVPQKAPFSLSAVLARTCMLVPSRLIVARSAR